jgi:hypothetical protein
MTIKYFKVKAALVLLLMLATLLAGCQGGVVKETNYYVGRDGLVMELANKNSLDEVYEDTSFAVNLAIENKGAYSVAGEEQAILTIGFDPFFISADGAPQDSKLFVGKSSVVIKGLSFVGKSKYYPSGSKAFVYFPYFKTKPIEGQRSKPETQLFASICYPYRTTLSALACVDFDPYQDSTRTQVCRQKDLKFSDQGAPIAVDLIEVENYPLGGLVKPVFTIHIRNLGGGTVLRPFDNGLELERVCTAQELERQDFNTLGVEAWLSNSIMLACNPKTVKLDKGEGVVRCEVAGEDIEKALPFRQNYQAALTINLSYVYLSTLKKDLEIKRINPYSTILDRQGVEACEAFQVSVAGECVSKCEYCTKRPQDALCNPSQAEFGISWNSAFSCACSKSTCDSLYPKGLCVPFSNYCPAASYCCTNPCPDGKIRLSGGSECFPKCLNTCVSITNDCICASREAGTLANSGQFCSRLGILFDTADSCRAQS